MRETEKESGEEEPPDQVIQTQDVEASISSMDLLWENSASGKIRAEASVDDVAIDLMQGDGDQTTASVRAYFDIKVAQDILRTLKRGDSGKWETHSCSMWIDRGWLQHQGSLRNEEKTTATFCIETKAGEAVLQSTLQEDTNNEITVKTQINSEQCEFLISAIEYGIKVAKDYEPIEPKDSIVSSDSRVKRLVGFVIPTGITLGIAYGVMSRLNSHMAQNKFTINGEPVNAVPNPEIFVVIMALVLLLVHLILHLPGRVGGGR